MITEAYSRTSIDLHCDNLFSRNYSNFLSLTRLHYLFATMTESVPHVTDFKYHRLFLKFQKH